MGEGVADVTIRYGPVPRNLEVPVLREDGWQASPGQYLLLGGAHGGRFLAERGKIVTVQRNDYAKDERLCHHFLGYVMPAVLRQRGMLVLHAGAALLASGEALLVAGSPGAGKSTTLLALVERGSRLLADDVTVLTVSAARRVEILPGNVALCLRSETAARLGRDPATLERRTQTSPKVVVPVEEAAVDEPAHLWRIALLVTGDGELRAQRVTGAARIPALLGTVRGPVLPQEVPEILRALCEVAGHVDVLCVTRPQSAWTVSELLDLVTRPIPTGAARDGDGCQNGVTV